MSTFLETEHALYAQDAIDQGDRIRNADHWGEGRDAAAAYYAQIALVHATLAVAERLDQILGLLESRGVDVNVK